MAQTVSEEVEELLTGDPVAAHLATCAEGRPHAAPVWFRYEPAEGDERPVIEVMTTGKKLANIRENPRVALSIQKSEAGHPEWTITVRGTATVVEDEEENERANRRINRRYGTDPDDWSENTLVRIAVGSASSQTY
ncbi:pyridoxamine 5'-phosphate oxidase family protein [Halosimplex sp. TS25]|uniref:pyridoxamine 5'-phosphate oxidase family protein n=1 Tax=Halosimplex rarum TaxID=3396619 RepID=UPI0039EB54C1